MGTSLEELRVLQAAEAIADTVWDAVEQWQAFARDTVGQQLVRAVDSIGANIAEAFGRYHYGEKVNYLYYARGSLFETKYWINRATVRSLLSEAVGASLAKQLNALAQQLNAFVTALKAQRFTASGKESRQTRESDVAYQADPAPDQLVFSEADLSWLTGNPNPQPDSEQHSTS